MHHSNSPLVKRLLQIRDEILEAFGSPEVVTQPMADWFGQQGQGVAQAYEHFRQSGAKKV